MESKVISSYETVTDRNGKKHKIYAVRFKDLQTVTNFTEKYRPDAFSVYALAPVVDDDGNIQKTKDGKIDYNNGFIDDLMEMMELALDGRESRAEIEEWLDIKTAQEIIMLFLDMSKFKEKKQ